MLSNRIKVAFRFTTCGLTYGILIILGSSKIIKAILILFNIRTIHLSYKHVILICRCRWSLIKCLLRAEHLLVGLRQCQMTISLKGITRWHRFHIKSTSFIHLNLLNVLEINHTTLTLWLFQYSLVLFNFWYTIFLSIEFVGGLLLNVYLRPVKLLCRFISSDHLVDIDIIRLRINALQMRLTLS